MQYSSKLTQPFRDINKWYSDLHRVTHRSSKFFTGSKIYKRVCKAWQLMTKYFTDIDHITFYFILNYPLLNGDNFHLIESTIIQEKEIIFSKACFWQIKNL